MGFVKTAEEISRLQQLIRAARFYNHEILRVEFLTEPDFVAHVLPPGLEPTDSPRMYAQIGRWQSNCVGDYSGGTIAVAAKCDGIESWYLLAMFKDTEPSIILGREVFGEPKKFVTTGMFRRDGEMNAWIDRHGVRLIEIQATLTTDLGAETTSGPSLFILKAIPAVNGCGLEGGVANMTIAEHELTCRVRREGEGELILRGTVHDPLDEIPLVSMVRAIYTEGDLQVTDRRVLYSLNEEDALPYAYSRYDDWSALDSGGLGAIREEPYVLHR